MVCRRGVIQKPQKWGGVGPRWLALARVGPQHQKKKTRMHHGYCANYTFPNFLYATLITLLIGCAAVQPRINLLRFRRNRLSPKKTKVPLACRQFCNRLRSKRQNSSKPKPPAHRSLQARCTTVETEPSLGLERPICYRVVTSAMTWLNYVFAGFYVSNLGAVTGYCLFVSGSLQVSPKDVQICHDCYHIHLQD